MKREAKSPFIFVSERGAPFSVSGLAKLIERAGIEAKIPFPVHAHMLRHACGYALANKGTDTRTLQAYLGHRSIQSTVRYTELAPGRFKNLWRTKHWLCGSSSRARSSSSSWPPISTSDGRQIRRTWPV